MSIPNIEPEVPISGEFILRNSAQGRRRMVKLLMQRDGDCCRYCRDRLYTTTATIEHLTPQSRGGSNRISNLALSCQKCNNAKNSFTDEEYMRILAGDHPDHCELCGEGLTYFDQTHCSGHTKRSRVMAGQTPIFHAMLVAVEDPTMRRMILNDAPRRRSPITDYL